MQHPHSWEGPDVDVLVTGGNGYVGHHLVAALKDRGDPVRVLALPGEDVSWLLARDVEVHRGDVCRPDTLAKPDTRRRGGGPPGAGASQRAAPARTARSTSTARSTCAAPHSRPACAGSCT